MFQGLPRWLIAFGIVVIAVIEITSRLPDIMLLPQKLAGGAGEYGAKALQPQLTGSQITKTEADARLAETQAAKTAAETKIAQLQADVTAAQAAKTRADTQLAQMQALAAAAQAQKTEVETQVAQLQRALTVSQAAQADAQARQANAQATKTNIENATTVATLGMLAVGAAYVADKAGLISHDPSSSPASSAQPRGQTASGQTGTISAQRANVRSCPAPSCDIVNRNDPILQGTKITITGDEVLDGGQHGWLPVVAASSTRTYRGFMASELVDGN